MSLKMEEIKGFEYKIVFSFGKDNKNKRVVFNERLIPESEFLEDLNKGHVNPKIISFSFVECVKFILDSGEIFNNEKECIKYVNDKAKLDEENKIFYDKQKQKEEEKQNILNKKEKYLNLYLDSIKNVMQKGKIKKVLYKKCNYIFNGKSEGIFERFIYLEKIKDSCFKTAYEEVVYYNKDLNQVKKWKYRVYLDADSLRDLTKIEYDYLNFIKGLKNE